MAKIPGTGFTSQQQYNPSTRGPADYSAQIQGARARQGMRQGLKQSVQQLGDVIGNIASKAVRAKQSQVKHEVRLQARKQSNRAVRSLTRVSQGATQPVPEADTTQNQMSAGGVRETRGEDQGEDPMMLFQDAESQYDRYMDEWFEDNYGDSIFSGVARREFENIKAQGREQAISGALQLQQKYISNRFTDNLQSYVEANDPDGLVEFMQDSVNSGVISPWKADEAKSQALQQMAANSLTENVDALLNEGEYQAALRVTKVPSQEDMDQARELLRDGKTDEARELLGDTFSDYVDPQSGEVKLLPRDTIKEVRGHVQDRIEQARTETRFNAYNEYQTAILRSDGDLNISAIKKQLANDGRLDRFPGSTQDLRKQLLSMLEEKANASSEGRISEYELLTKDHISTIYDFAHSEELTEDQGRQVLARELGLEGKALDQALQLYDDAANVPANPAVSSQYRQIENHFEALLEDANDEAERSEINDRYMSAVGTFHREIARVVKNGNALSTEGLRDDYVSDIANSVISLYSTDQGGALQGFLGLSGEKPQYGSVRDLFSGGVAGQDMSRLIGGPHDVARLLKFHQNRNLSVLPQEKRTALFSNLRRAMADEFERSTGQSPVAARPLNEGKVVVMNKAQSGDKPNVIQTESYGNVHVYTLEYNDDGRNEGMVEWKVWDTDSQEFKRLNDDWGQVDPAFAQQGEEGGSAGGAGDDTMSADEFKEQRGGDLGGVGTGGS